MRTNKGAAHLQAHPWFRRDQPLVDLDEVNTVRSHPGLVHSGPVCQRGHELVDFKRRSPCILQPWH